MCLNNTSLIYPIQLKEAIIENCSLGTQSLLWEELKSQTLIVQKPSK